MDVKKATGSIVVAQRIHVNKNVRARTANRADSQWTELRSREVLHHTSKFDTSTLLPEFSLTFQECADCPKQVNLQLLTSKLEPPTLKYQEKGKIITREVHGLCIDADPSFKDQQNHQRWCQCVDFRGQTGQAQKQCQKLQKRPCVTRHSVKGRKILATTPPARGCLKTAGSTVVDAKIPDTRNVRSSTNCKSVMNGNVNLNSVLVATTDETKMFRGPQENRTSDYGNREERKRCASSPNFTSRNTEP